jgi:hypothetical protein
VELYKYSWDGTKDLMPEFLNDNFWSLHVGSN